jgi:chromosome segregation ATPase
MFTALRQYPRQLVGALQSIATAIEAVRAQLEVTAEQPELPPQLDMFDERITTIERSLATWTAEMEAQLMRAESDRKQARAAEERARHKEAKIAKAMEGDDDELGDIPEEYRRLLHDRNGEGSADQGMLELPPGMGARGKAHRRATKNAITRLKFGG